MTSLISNSTVPVPARKTHPLFKTSAAETVRLRQARIYPALVEAQLGLPEELLGLIVQTLIDVNHCQYEIWRGSVRRFCSHKPHLGGLCETHYVIHRNESTSGVPVEDLTPFATTPKECAASLKRFMNRFAGFNRFSLYGPYAVRTVKFHPPGLTLHQRSLLPPFAVWIQEADSFEQTRCARCQGDLLNGKHLWACQVRVWNPNRSSDRDPLQTFNRLCATCGPRVLLEQILIFNPQVTGGDLVYSQTARS